MLDQAELSCAIRRHADTVRRVCALYSALTSDAEDVFQEVFLKFATHPGFESPDHEKHWLITVTMNTCKDLLKSARFKRSAPSDQLALYASESISDEVTTVLNAVRNLKTPLRETVYLHYYEGYTAVEIAQLLNSRPNTVYSWLARARKLLEEALHD
ncbi:MAG: sigma-70 family RNA polymerase sigma factor [Propionibacteriaceae bacterium]|jgi:RNA polymerase sigma-70 factor (ECF subfamily)|nr:sigma-70 family RNA polymerase sigma factor [Propionibacteriaceae bacterium]